MRLTVLIGLLMEIGSRAAVANGLFGEEMRFGAAFVDEELAKVEIFFLAGHAGQFYQRQLDFLVAAIAAQLAFAMAEGLDEIVAIAAHDVEQLAFACRLEIGDRPSIR